ncbi:MAG: DUF3820 family protein [Fusobacteria bacterium]|nr:DUF3820 family protein [Fusobacteriota bacterium]
MIIFLDTETTDGTQSCKICQLAFRVDGVNFVTYAKNVASITFEAMAVHHITNEMVESALPLEQTSVFAKLLEINTPDNFIVAHNANFDLQALANHGFVNKMQVIDTVKISKAMLDTKWYKLQYLRYALGLYKQETEFIQPHDALSDILVLEKLYYYLQTTYKIDASHMNTLCNQRSFVKKMPFGKHKGILIEKIDSDYLSWILNNATQLDDDLKFSILHTLKQNGFIQSE